MANVSRLLFIALKQADDNRKETETILEKAKRMGAKGVQKGKDAAKYIAGKFVTPKKRTVSMGGLGFAEETPAKLTRLGKGSLIGGGILAAGAGGRYLYNRNKQADDNRKETETILEKAKRKSSEMYESAKNIGSKGLRKADELGRTLVTKEMYRGSPRRRLTKKGKILGGSLATLGLVGTGYKMNNRGK